MLNENQVKFCEEYVANGYNGKQAYMTAYSQENENTSAVAAHKLLRTSKIVEKIEEIEGNYRIIGHKLGIDKKLILNRLKDLLDAKKEVFFNGKVVGEMSDYGAINKAAETLLKILGDFSPEKKEISLTEDSIDFSKMTEEEKKEYKERLLRELS
jgi:hypothetical protein